LQVLSEAEIVKRQEEMVGSVVSVLSVTDSAAAILLRHFKWNITRLHDHWFQDEDAVRKAAGLPARPEGDGGDSARPVRATRDTNPPP
jgi:ariadne-1